MRSALCDWMMLSNRTMWAVAALAVGAGVAAVYLPPARTRRLGQALDSSRVDEASEDSFPASDPPSFSAPSVSVPGPTS